MLSKDTVLEKSLDFAKTKEKIKELQITVGVFRNQQSDLMEQAYNLFNGALCFDENRNIMCHLRTGFQFHPCPENAFYGKIDPVKDAHADAGD